MDKKLYIKGGQASHMSHPYPRHTEATYRRIAVARILTTIASHQKIFRVRGWSRWYAVQLLETRWVDVVFTSRLALLLGQQRDTPTTRGGLRRRDEERRHGMDDLQVIDQVLRDGVLQRADDLSARLVMGVDREVGIEHLVCLADGKGDGEPVAPAGDGGRVDIVLR